MAFNEISDPFRRLVRIMERLQEPGGCPWDLDQTHESLKPYMIEEAYEALDAIDRGNLEDLKEELGDVLLQVVFHSVLAARQGGFKIDEVIEGASAKMVRRHPHVFGETEAKTATDVLHNWEKLKAGERAHKANANLTDNSNASVAGTEPHPHSILSGVPKTLPALLKAQRMQEKAARVGFDFPDIQPVLGKVREEIAELEAAHATGDTEHAREEFGDLVFALVNLARFMKIDAEEAARQSSEKFRARFEFIESRVRESGRQLGEMTLAEMDALWDQAKSREVRVS